MSRATMLLLAAALLAGCTRAEVEGSVGSSLRSWCRTSPNCATGENADKATSLEGQTRPAR